LNLSLPTTTGTWCVLFISVDENNNFGYNAGNNGDIGALTKYKKIRVIMEVKLDKLYIDLNKNEIIHLYIVQHFENTI
jgi:hypothetical protein